MAKITKLIFNFDTKKGKRVSVEKGVNIQTGSAGTNVKVQAKIASVIRTQRRKFDTVFVVARFDNGEHRTILSKREI